MVLIGPMRSALPSFVKGRVMTEDPGMLVVIIVLGVDEVIVVIEEGTLNVGDLQMVGLRERNGGRKILPNKLSGFMVRASQVIEWTSLLVMIASNLE